MEEAFYTALIKTALGWINTLGRKIFKKKPISIEKMKKETQVLFIDDEPFDPLLENILQAGWSVRQKKDVDNLDAEDIRNADIIFIDYKGVGTLLSPSEEGIGILKTLRKKYPQKYLIFYSGYAGLIPGHEVHNIADGWIQKNSDPYVYIERIESAARIIYGRKK